MRSAGECYQFYPAIARIGQDWSSSIVPCPLLVAANINIVTVCLVASSVSNSTTGLRTVLIPHTYFPTNANVNALISAGWIGKEQPESPGVPSEELWHPTSSALGHISKLGDGDNNVE